MTARSVGGDSGAPESGVPERGTFDRDAFDHDAFDRDAFDRDAFDRDALDRLFALLEEGLGPQARRDVALGPFTTFRLGGPAAVAVTVDSAGDLLRVRRAIGATTGAGTPIPLLVVGQGSNLLVADDGFAGLVVLLGSGLSTIRIDGTTVEAGGAVKLPVLARRTVAEGLTGLEWAVGVPGSVGGAVRMNAGGHGSDVKASLQRCEVVRLTGEPDRAIVAAGALGLGYRTSQVGAGDVVVSATFQLQVGDAAAGAAELAEIVRWRREHQPGGANCGSVFTNPPGDSAGRLIDAAGMRGHRLGTASVSAKHANFIQADEGGRAADVWSLITLVRRRVHERFGIVLHPEVCTAGFDARLEPLPGVPGSAPPAPAPGGAFSSERPPGAGPEPAPGRHATSPSAPEAS